MIDFEDSSKSVDNNNSMNIDDVNVNDDSQHVQQL